MLQNNAAIALLRTRSHDGLKSCKSRRFSSVIEVHSACKKRSQSVVSGIAGYADLLQSTNGQQHFTEYKLREFNITRLQVVLNDMHNEIGLLNQELVDLLVQRDDLHMQQDARLVDIEDHTRRAKEMQGT